MIRLNIAFWLLALVASSTYSQYSETIVTGRPGQAFGPYTVGAKIFQNQTGIAAFDEAVLGTRIRRYGGESIFRYGVLERFEINALLNCAFNPETLFADEQFGVDAFSLGFRYHIFSGSGLKPSIGFQYRLKSRAVSRPFRKEGIGSVASISTSQEISNRIGVVTNNSIIWDGEDATPDWAYVLNLSFALSEQLGLFIENYGGIDDSEFESRFDGGISFLASDNLQLDLLGGAGRNNGTIDYFISTGISWRVGRSRGLPKGPQVIQSI